MMYLTNDFMVTRRASARQDHREKSIRFFNHTTLADVTDADVDVFLVYGDDEVSSLPLCRTFVVSGRLWMDCAPVLNRMYVAPVPDDVLVSRNEECLATGRYGVFVPVWSRLGRLVAELVDLTERKRRAGAG